jgi:zinc/manganese transport system ATP-binding protein
MSETTTSRGDRSPLAELQGVTVQLDGRNVLHNVSAEIWPDEFIGVIGPNGAGKTTLLRLLLGLLHPVTGIARFEGEPIRRGNPRVGYCPQVRAVDRDLPLTSRDFVSLGLDGHRWGWGWPSRQKRERIDEVLESVGALAYANVPIGQLSGGEQQRLAIAQALLTQPSMLLLDEPLASLDLRSQGEIVTLVSRLSKERHVTVLFVTHTLNPLLEVLDRVWYLAGGRSAIGPVADVVRPDVLSHLYESPVDVIQAHGRIFVVAGE